MGASPSLLQPLVSPPVPCPPELGEAAWRKQEGEESQGAGLEGGLNSGRWGARGGCGQFGKRFEMELKVKNHLGLGRSPDFLGENLGVWEVIRGEQLISFVEEKGWGERGEVHELGV